MNLSVRDLSPEDNISQIFTLCKENNLLSASYATSEPIWDFQYKNNPIRRSWNTVIYDKDSDSIVGHIGLVPLPALSFPNKYLAGSVSNAVVSPRVRNKLIPFNESKTFPIIPLIDRCCESAFESKVDFVFAFSSIPRVIWKTLKFTSIEFSIRITIHSGAKELLKEYRRNISSDSGGVIAKVLKSIFLCNALILHKLNRFACFARYSAIKNRISISNVDRFDDEFLDVISRFNNSNTDIITYDRQIDFLSWRFGSNQFIKLKIYKDSSIIGYAILKKSDSERNAEMCTMIDFLVLDEYISNIPNILYLIQSKNKISFRFHHHLSCVHAQKVFCEARKSGHTFGRNPFKENKNSAKSHPPFYFKANPNGQSDFSEDLKGKEWFITPIFFLPSYYAEG